MKAATDSRTSEPLAHALRRLAEDLAQVQPGAHLPAAALQALDRRTRAAAEPARLVPGWRWLGGALAAMLCVLAVGLQLIVPGPRAVADGSASATPTAFLPIVDAERLQQLALGGEGQVQAWVVPTELPRETLGGLGLPYDPARAGQTVSAELLVHPGGEVLAVRFLR